MEGDSGPVILQLSELMKRSPRVGRLLGYFAVSEMTKNEDWKDLAEIVVKELGAKKAIEIYKELRE